MTTVQLLKRPAKLKSGKRVHYWTLRHFDSRGKAVTESIGRVGVMTKAAAEAAREDKLIAIGGGTMPRDKARKVTLAEYAGEHAAMIAGVVRRTSALEYGHSFAHAIDAIGGDVALADIGAVEVGRIREHVAAKRAPATVVKTLATLRAAFRRAVDAGLIFKNPFHRVAMPKVEVGEHRIYSADEVRAMVEAAPNLWWAALIQLAATSGLRKAELLHVRWADVDLSAGEVRVRGRKAGTFTAGGETFAVLPWSPKASASTRAVPVPPATVTMLQRLKLASDGSAYLFLDLDRLRLLAGRVDSGGLPCEAVRNLGRDFATIQRRAAAALAERDARATGKPVAELVKRWRMGTLHDLRRTFATTASKALPIHALKAYCGHADIATTARFYCQTDADDAAKLREAMAKAAVA